MGNGQAAVATVIPPVELNDFLKSEIGNEIEHVMGHDQSRRSARHSARVLYDRTQGWPVQVVKMRMGHQHQVDRWQIVDTEAWFSNALQKKQPAREIRVNQDAPPAHLHKERCMT